MLKIEIVKKMDDFFTLSPYKITRPKFNNISAHSSLEV